MKLYATSYTKYTEDMLRVEGDIIEIYAVKSLPNTQCDYVAKWKPIVSRSSCTAHESFLVDYNFYLPQEKHKNKMECT